MLYIESGRIVVSDCATESKASGAVLRLSAGPTAVGLSAIAAVTAMGRVVRERCGINDEASGVGQDGASPRGPTVKRRMSAKAVGAEGIAAAAASGAIQIKGGVRHCNATESVEAAATAFPAEVAAVLTSAGIAAGSCAIFKRRVVDGSGAGGDISAAALGGAACSSVLLVTWTVAANPTGGVAVVDSRAVDVECAASEIDRATLGIGGITVVEVASVPA